MLFPNQPLNVVQQLQYGSLLLRRHGEEIGDMPARHDDDVSRRKRVIVVARICSGILGEHLRRRAELTVHRFGRKTWSVPDFGFATRPSSVPWSPDTDRAC